MNANKTPNKRKMIEVQYARMVAKYGKRFTAKDLLIEKVLEIAKGGENE